MHKKCPRKGGHYWIRIYAALGKEGKVSSRVVR